MDFIFNSFPGYYTTNCAVCIKILKYKKEKNNTVVSARLKLYSSNSITLNVQDNKGITMNPMQIFVVKFTWKEVQMSLLLYYNSLNLLPASHYQYGG